MISMLKGNVIDYEDELATVATDGGVAYEIRLHDPCIGSVNVYVHMHCPQDEAPQLYGFRTKQERSTFKRLIAIQGVGPTVAMRIIGNRGVTPEGLVVKSTLLAVRGVGEKIATRILEVMG